MATARTRPTPSADTAGERVLDAGLDAAAIAAERPVDPPAADPFAQMEAEHRTQRERNAAAEAEALRANGETNRRVEEYARRATEESEIRAGLLE